MDRKQKFLVSRNFGVGNSELFFQKQVLETKIQLPKQKNLLRVVNFKKLFNWNESAFESKTDFERKISFSRQKLTNVAKFFCYINDLIWAKSGIFKISIFKISHLLRLSQLKVHFLRILSSQGQLYALSRGNFGAFRFNNYHLKNSWMTNWEIPED